MSSFRRRSLVLSGGYVPGEQPDDDSDWLKLNTNESPFGPSPAVAPAMASVAAMLRRYPNPDAEPLRSAIAAHHGIDPASVLVGNGADDVLNCCLRAFCEPGDAAVWPTPSYSLLGVLARIHGVRAVELPLDDDLSLPDRLGTEPGHLRVVCNPNSPTGVWMPPDALEELLAPAPGVVVIDEAYCDFAPMSALNLLPRHESWVVVRTFSKAHALAGLRVGYAVGAPEVIEDLRVVRDSYPVDRGAIAGAMAALADTDHHRSIVSTVLAQRARLTEALVAAGWTVTPSHANFVFARPPSGTAAADVAERLRESHILVRRLDSHPNHLRISVGAAPDVDRLLTALGAVLQV